MHAQYRRKEVVKCVSLALSVLPLVVFGAEPYPSTPLILNSGVTPNIMLFVDTSTSMSGYMEKGYCRLYDPNRPVEPNNPRATEKPNPPYPACANNGSIGIARRVLAELVSDKSNRKLNWGLFTFDNKTLISGVLQSPIKNRADENSFKELTDKISGLYPYNSTPLSASTYELSRYWRGMETAYDKRDEKDKKVSILNYESPIKYRCQKNYQIIISDGAPSHETNLQKAAEEEALKNYGIEKEKSDDNNFIRLTKFMYQQDMRNTDEKDLEGKSFNESPFEIQNVISYIVGFTVNLPLLKNAAEQAGGKYYTINHGSDSENEKELAHTLTNVVDSIIDQNSNAGGLAAESDAKSDGNFLYQPSFSSKGWYGELKRFSFSNNVIDKTSFQEAGASLTKQHASKHARNIHSATYKDNKLKRFEFTEDSIYSMSKSQRKYLGTDDAEGKKVIRFLRGDTEAGQRVRTTLLGDFIDTKPVFVGKPSGASLDTSYDKFKETHALRSMVFIGANDGMMHGFDASKPITPGKTPPPFEEVVGYIPSMVYRNLKTLSSPNYGKGTDPHVYHVSGPAVAQDIKAEGGWKTLLISGLGQGGKGYFALDVTTQDNFKKAEKTVRWEWNNEKDKDVGYSFGKPVVYSVRTGKDSAGTDTFTPVVVLSNGYENNFDTGENADNKGKKNTSALYILNADSGKLINKITVAGSNGLSSPRGLDADFDGTLDYVYAGDENGTMWRFELPENITPSSVITPVAIFKTEGNKPIIQAPRILPVRGKETKKESIRPNDKGFRGYLILFGSGRLLTAGDNTDSTAHEFYGVLDTMEEKPTIVTQDKLLEQTLTTLGGYRVVSDNPINLEEEAPEGKEPKYKGWNIKFGPYERLTSEILLHGRRIMFATGIPQDQSKNENENEAKTQTCTSPSRGWIMGLDALTGSTVRTKRNVHYSFIDRNENGKSDEGDKVKDEGTEPRFSCGYPVNGTPKDILFTKDSNSTNPLSDNKSSTTNSGSGSGSTETNFDKNGVPYSPNNGVDEDNNIGGNNSGKRGNECSKDNSSKGSATTGPQGSESTDKQDTNGAPGCGVRLERVTWRELIN